MAFVTTKEYAQLVKRVEKLETRLGLNEVTTIEQALTLQDVYGEDVAQVLAEGGFKTPQQVSEATDEELLAVSGIGPARLKSIHTKYISEDKE